MVLWFNFLKITLAVKSTELRYERESERVGKGKRGINYRVHKQFHFILKSDSQFVNRYKKLTFKKKIITWPSKWHVSFT